MLLLAFRVSTEVRWCVRSAKKKLLCFSARLFALPGLCTHSFIISVSRRFEGDIDNIFSALDGRWSSWRWRGVCAWWLVFGRRRKSEQGQVQQAPARGMNITPLPNITTGPLGVLPQRRSHTCPTPRHERDTLEKHNDPLFRTRRAHAWPAVGVTHLAGEAN